MSDATMCQLLSVADLGHIIALCNHHSNNNTAGPFHILNGGLMSDVTMCQWLSVADLGHIIALLVLPSVKNLADFIQS